MERARLEQAPMGSATSSSCVIHRSKVQPFEEACADRARIFGIGLNKTGTCSLDAALSQLGFRCLHHGGRNVEYAVQKAIDLDAPLLSNLDPRVDAFTDIGLLSRRFCSLDAQYPGSVFILTVRPIDDWLESRIRHVQRNQQNKARYRGRFLTVAEDEWRDEWNQHLSAVRTYFTSDVGDDGPDPNARRRRRYLEIDLTRNASWDTLCSLLGLPEPETPFPWENKIPASL
jgi:Sulfotransferase domain